MQSADKQLEILVRGVDATYTVEDLGRRLEKCIAEKRPLRVKLGMDPTAPDLHLGHCVVLDKMRQFQDLGHKAVLIIGDYTAMIGDPTGQNKTRPMLSPEQIAKNAETYFQQAGKVLDTSPERLEIRRNSEWLGQMNFADVVRLTSQMTVARMLERDTFEERHKAGVEIGVHEFLYPLCQGWDSVQIQSDVELGGTDQTFNNLVGRDLQRSAGQPPQVVLIMPILEGTDGVEKMSKSKGNYIGVNDRPKEMFGKTMAISDELMWKWYRLAVGRSDPDLAELKKGHPMEAKKMLASALVKRFHGAAAAELSRTEFEKQFSTKELADVALDFVVAPGSNGLVDLVDMAFKASAASIPSRSDIRRLITQGGVQLDGQKLTDPQLQIDLKEGQIFRIGKRTVVKVRLRT